MAIYQKADDVWAEAARFYVHRNGVYTGGTEAYVKSGGVWVKAHDYDVVPPNPPEITLSISEDFDIVSGKKQLQSRWIRVGVRLPGSANDPEARLTRVLTTYADKPPTTPLGGTYHSTPDSSYPHEAWSNWRYNASNAHPDTSAYVYKQYPVNASGSYKIPGDRTYHFGGWSLDQAGNWSIATQAAIHVPKASVDVPNVVVKETTIQPNSSGSWRSTGFQSGDLIQQNSPRSVGLWFYGNQFTDSIGAQGAVTIRNADIYILRGNDSGQANANIYLFWNGYGSSGALPAPGSAITKTEIKKLGELAKGQGKWFSLPSSFNNNLNTSLKCMGLDYKDPIKATAFPEDYSTVIGTHANLKVGQVRVVWEEQL